MIFINYFIINFWILILDKINFYNILKIKKIPNYDLSFFDKYYNLRLAKKIILLKYYFFNFKNYNNNNII